MKRKYIEHRSSLLIGLLSLSILSSCTHTKQKLGMGGGASKKNQDVESGGSNNNTNNNSNKGWKDSAKNAGYVALGGVISTAGNVAYNYYTKQNNNGCASNTPSSFNFRSDGP